MSLSQSDPIKRLPLYFQFRPVVLNLGYLIWSQEVHNVVKGIKIMVYKQTLLLLGSAEMDSWIILIWWEDTILQELMYTRKITEILFIIYF